LIELIYYLLITIYCSLYFTPTPKARHLPASINLTFLKSMWFFLCPSDTLSIRISGLPLAMKETNLYRFSAPGMDDALLFIGLVQLPMVNLCCFIHRGIFPSTPTSEYCNFLQL